MSSIRDIMYRYWQDLRERKDTCNRMRLYQTDTGSYWYERTGYWGVGPCGRYTWISGGCYLIEYGPVGKMRSVQVRSPAQARKILSTWRPEYPSAAKMMEIAVIPAYKVVAVDGGRYVSIYDGTTEYAMGKTTSAPLLARAARICDGGGIFVYRADSSIYDARSLASDVQYPQDSRAADKPRAVLYGYAWGRKHWSMTGNKIAAEYFRPAKVVYQQ